MYVKYNPFEENDTLYRMEYPQPQQNPEDQSRKYWFFGSKLNTVLLLVLIVLMILALRIMMQDKGRYFPRAFSTEEEKVEKIIDQKNIGGNFEKITKEDFSFVAPKGLVQSSLNFNNCPWFSISVPNDGHVGKGEIGIYPISCYDLSKSVVIGEYVEKMGYYIIHSFDSKSMTTDEIEYSREIYKKIIDTFTLNN